MAECKIISDFLLAILQQTELLSYDKVTNIICLGMEQSRIAVVNEIAASDIKQALRNYFTPESVRDVVIESKQSLQNTLKQHNQEEDLKQTQAKEEIILSNKVVQEIITNFDAKRII